MGSHGYGDNGQYTDSMRHDFLVHVAGQGYVIVAHQSPHIVPRSNHEDQIAMIDWVYADGKYKHLVDKSSTMLMGYSMGGRATLYNAGQQELVQKYSIKAAAVFHP